MKDKNFLKLSHEQEFEISKISVVISELTIEDLKTYLLDLTIQCFVQQNRLTQLARKIVSGDLLIQSPEESDPTILSLEQSFSCAGIESELKAAQNKDRIKEAIFKNHKFLIVQKLLFNKMTSDYQYHL